MNQNYDVCIIGAGASGLAAANTLDPALSICIIDRNEVPGRKIMATGGGRCNLTNRACRRHEMTLDFFHGLGLETRCDEEGRFYPYSMVAADVRDALVAGLEGRNIDLITNSRVIDAVAREGDFVIRYEGPDSRKSGDRPDSEGEQPREQEREVRARYLIIATGGKAAPKMATTGDGYGLAKGLGHSIERTYPILTGIDVDIPKNLAGIRARGEVILLEDGAEKAREKGEMQFTADGLSGICVFDLTPHIRIREGEKPGEGMKRFSLVLDMAPDLTQEDVLNRKNSFGILTKPLADWIPPEEIKHKTLPVRGVWGWDKAQATAGGVSMDEVDRQTYGSVICPGLYFAGEILDIQGPCGGYNLQNAWESGILAAKAINAEEGHRPAKDRGREGRRVDS